LVILVTGAIIGILGIISSAGRAYVITTSVVLLAIGLRIFLSTIKKK
jgi:hypothetical protein